MAHLEYHFDIVCPYAYLGSTQVEAICERTSATMSWHPVLLGGILVSVGRDPMFTTQLAAQKARHNVQDMYRWADCWDVPFKFHPRHPVRTVKTQRALLVAKPSPDLIQALYKAYWVDNRDLDNPNELAAVITETGRDGTGIVEETNNPAIKQRLRDVTDQVVNRGAFGVPAMFVGDTLIWGQDRLHFVEHLLRGESLESR